MTTGVIFMALCIPITQCQADVQIYYNETTWQTALSELGYFVYETFDTTAANMVLADEVSTPPGYNENLGRFLTFPKSATGLDCSFMLEAIETGTGEGFIYDPEGFVASGHENSLAVGDGHTGRNNDDFTVTFSDCPFIHAFGFDLLENDNFNNQDDDILYVYDTLGNLLATFPDIPEGPGAQFVGIVSDVEIGYITFDEGNDLDNIAIAKFRFSKLGPHCTITLNSGCELNGQPVDVEYYNIDVVAGEEISGCVNIHVNSSYSGSAVVTLCRTHTWDQRENNPVYIQSISPGDHDITLPISGLFASIEPGTYHIIIAASGEYHEDQICSATNWSTGAPVWNDGNDLGWDWNTEQFQAARDCGVVLNDLLWPSGYALYPYGATWIEVNVHDAYHVDTYGGSDSNRGFSKPTAFKTIQKAIQTAGNKAKVIVWPGEYAEDIDFMGKAITVKSAADAAHITAPGTVAVTFDSGEGPDTVFENFVVRDSVIGIRCIASSPTIRNVTVVDNIQGIVAEAAAAPDINHAIVWDNVGSDLSDASASYSYTPDNLDGFAQAWSAGTYQSAFDSSGRLFVANGLQDRVEIFDTSGNLLDTIDSSDIPGDSFTFPAGIAISPLGYLYVGDIGNTTPALGGERIYQFTLDGTFIAEVGQGQFTQPECIATDQSGNLYITDYFGNNAKKLDSSGALISTIATGLNAPVGIAVDTDGIVYIADHLNNTIRKYSSVDSINYTQVASWDGTGTDAGQLSGPCELALDGMGRILVADSANDRIVVFTTNGDYVTQMGREGSGLGQFNQPWGLEVDDAGNVYIGDELNQRIQKLAFPQFVDPTNNDFHLRSQRGRYMPHPTDPNDPGLWVLDTVSSPCIDAGDPNLNPSTEPMPNGGRINIGAYGSTISASMSEWPLKHDSDQNGIVNLADFAVLSEEWLNTLPWVE